MSKRYVIQVLAENVLGDQEWQNVQHPAGGDWLTRSKTTALNDAVTLVFRGEIRPLRIAESKPVYATSPLAELDVAAAVALAMQIGHDLAAEAEANGVSLEDVLADTDENDDEDYDDSDEDENDENDENDDAPTAEFELVDESNDFDGNAHNN